MKRVITRAIACILLLASPVFAKNTKIKSNSLECPDDERLKVIRSEKVSKVKTVGIYSYVVVQDSKDSKIQMYLHQASFVPNGAYGLWMRTSDKMPCYIRDIFKLREIDNLFLDGQFMFIYFGSRNIATKDLEIIASRVGSILEIKLGATPAKPLSVLRAPSSLSSSSSFAP